ncbi:unnamed protein product [Callosobruchus maculatus]|uniref:Uncharacterized protein n=1 Tax=Callosobruchus maculatus TaxID=64391 RepID=A0A653CIX5_CALMS|nr:unnamed protein product [Callosobruchus maculatus]
MKMTAQMMTAAKVGFGMYEKYGVNKVNAKNTILAATSVNLKKKECVKKVDSQILFDCNNKSRNF